MKRFSLLILSILFFCQLMAQYESAGKPLRFSSESAGLKRSLSSFYVDIQADTTKIFAETQGRKLISGVTSKVDISMNDGVTFVEEGLKVWRVGVKSKNAKGISLFFDRFLLPEGGKLFVYNPDQSIVYGAFTSENNNSENKLLIRPLSSDSLVVEYLEPLNASFKADLHISLATHEMRSVNQFLKSNLCSPHASHEDKASLLKQSVCLLFMVGTTSSSYGSGSLINNPEHKPYVYTAGHNIEYADLATRTIYYFNYEVPAQDSTFQGSYQFTISGSKLLSRDIDVDFALVELNKMPPAEYRPYLAGWTRNTPKAPLMCIQHPYGDVKKVSYTETVPTISYFEDSNIKTYWWVKTWNKGVTEVGSSGSPLFDADGYIIGELTGGESYCDTPHDDYFCMLSQAWDYYSEKEKHLVSYLDPQGENIMYMEGYNPYSTAQVRRISNITNEDKVSINRINHNPLIGHNSYGYTEYAEKFEIENPVYVYGTYMIPIKGKYNASLPVKVNVYSGTDKPEKLLSSAEVYPTEAFCNRSGVWSEKLIEKYNKKEIYVPLEKPVLVEDNLFVSIQIKYENLTSADSLILASAVNKEECTAFFYNGGWKSFNNHPNGNLNASIWLDPVVANKNVVSIEEIESKSFNYRVYPNPTQGDVFVDASFEGEYKLYNLIGNLIQYENYSGLISLPEKGVYILELNPKVGKKETHKLICR